MKQVLNHHFIRIPHCNVTTPFIASQDRQSVEAFNSDARGAIPPQSAGEKRPSNGAFLPRSKASVGFPVFVHVHTSLTLVRLRRNKRESGEPEGKPKRKLEPADVSEASAIPPGIFSQTFLDLDIRM